VEAFGMAKKKDKSKNPRCRELIKKVQKAVEGLNKSETRKVRGRMYPRQEPRTEWRVMFRCSCHCWQAICEDYQREALETELKMVNAVPQRWSSLVKTLERVLLKWEALEKAWDPTRTEDDPTPPKFPLWQLKIQVRELYSVLRLVSDIIVLVQGRGYCTAADGWFKLIAMRVKELSGGDNIELNIYDPTQCVRLRLYWILTKRRSCLTICLLVAQRPTRGPTHRGMSLLNPLTKEVLGKLRIALDSRAFVRYAAERDDNSIMYDVLLYFHPACRSLWHISNIVRAVGGDASE
jgi:hypothetical protein